MRICRLVALFVVLFFYGSSAVSSQAAEIVQLGAQILQQPARPLTQEEISSPKVQALIRTMHETVHKKGVGLAAPQIGVGLKIAVIEDLQEYIDRLPSGIAKERDRHPVAFHVLINPEILWMDPEQALFFEGCLSVPNGVRITPRAKRIEVKFLNEFGQEQRIFAEGWYARILQHEIGHLNGTLFIDIADPRTEVSIQDYLSKWLTASTAEIEQFYKDKVQV